MPPGGHGRTRRLQGELGSLMVRGRDNREKSNYCASGKPNTAVVREAFRGNRVLPRCKDLLAKGHDIARRNRPGVVLQPKGEINPQLVVVASGRETQAHADVDVQR